MRDPLRIPRILKKLEKLWQRYPDQRLGQLLQNYVLGTHEVPQFYQEDDVTEATIDAAIKGT